MRFFLFPLLLLLALSSLSQKNPPADKRFAGLDTAFARILKDRKAAGFAVAVVEKGKVIYAKGFGYKDWEAKAPVTENTQFAIGSCTKAFTAALLGILQIEGKVDYDAPVRTYLPAFQFANNDMNNGVTLRDAMSHRTGVSRYDYSWYYFPSRSRDTLLKRMQFMTPSEPLRRRWQYNNFMYLLQGVVTEKLTGKSWEDNVREKLLQPLGMTNTNVSLAEWVKAPDVSKGYTVKGDSAISKVDYYDISGMAPAGSINSSVSDMAKWVAMWIGGGKHNGKEVLPSPYVSEAMTSQMVIGGALPSKLNADVHLSNYGLGWFLASYRGHYRVEHGGNIDGFSASTSFFPSDSIGIVVLVNQNGSSIPGTVRNLLTDRVLRLTYKDWHTQSFSADTAARAKAAAAAKTTPSTRKWGTASSHAAADYVGLYTSPGGERFEVEQRKDSLYMLLPGETWWLRHYHYDVFAPMDKDDMAAFPKDSAAGFGGIKVSFRMDESGNITGASLPLEGPVSPIQFSKSAKGKPLSKDSLQKYVGDYNLGGTTIKVYVKEENKLYVFVPGQPEYELANTGKDLFALKALTGFSVQFRGNTKGEIAEVDFIQPNGTFKATRVLKP